MADDMKRCNNCQRDVPITNYAIHVIHCERNIRLCEICSEPLNRSEMNEHFNTTHAREPCSKCGALITKNHIEYHMEICTKRSVSCDYCELEFPADELKEHVDACGARTEECPSCKKFVMLKDQPSHSGNCLKGVYTKLLIPCEYCELEFPADELKEHVDACGARTEECSACKKFVMLKDQRSHPRNCLRSTWHAAITEDIATGFSGSEAFVSELLQCWPCGSNVLQDDLVEHLRYCYEQKNVPCPYCGREFRENCLDMHLQSCAIGHDVCSVENKINNEKEKAMFEKKKPTIPTHAACIYCGSEVSFMELNVHESKCALIYGDSSTCDEVSSETRTMDNDHTVAHSVWGNQQSYKANSRACPFCHEVFPNHLLKEHLEKCQMCYHQCPTCLKSMPRSDISDHVCKQQGREVVRGRNTDELASFMSMVCPYCNCAIMEERFAEHIELCAKKEKKCRFCHMIYPVDDEKKHLNMCIQALKGGNDCSTPDISHTTTGPQTSRSKKKSKQKNGGLKNENWKKGEMTDEDWKRVEKANEYRKNGNPYEGFNSKQNNRNPTNAYNNFYKRPEVVQLPCEFCEKLFLADKLIEHQSGCRPDIVSFPPTCNSKPSQDASILTENFESTDKIGMDERRNLHKQKYKHTSVELDGNAAPSEWHSDHTESFNSDTDAAKSKNISKKPFDVNHELAARSTLGHRGLSVSKKHSGELLAPEKWTNREMYQDEDKVPGHVGKLNDDLNGYLQFMREKSENCGANSRLADTEAEPVIDSSFKKPSTFHGLVEGANSSYRLDSKEMFWNKGARPKNSSYAFKDAAESGHNVNSKLVGNHIQCKKNSYSRKRDSSDDEA